MGKELKSDYERLLGDLSSFLGRRSTIGESDEEKLKGKRGESLSRVVGERRRGKSKEKGNAKRVPYREAPPARSVGDQQGKERTPYVNGNVAIETTTNGELETSYTNRCVLLETTKVKKDRRWVTSYPNRYVPLAKTENEDVRNVLYRQERPTRNGKEGRYLRSRWNGRGNSQTSSSRGTTNKRQKSEVPWTEKLPNYSKSPFLPPTTSLVIIAAPARATNVAREDDECTVRGERG